MCDPFPGSTNAGTAEVVARSVGMHRAAGVKEQRGRGQGQWVMLSKSRCGFLVKGNAGAMRMERF